MFRSLFGKKKKPAAKVQSDESIRSAKVGDVVFIPGFWDDGEDAYLIVDDIGLVESAYGRANELTCADGDRRATIEWSDHDGLHISATVQDRPLGLSEFGLDYDTLVQWDEHKSLENSIEYEGERYFYRNSHEAFHHRQNSDEGEGFWVWEFMREDEGESVTVVKWEGMPFEAYVSRALSPHLVTVYQGSGTGRA